MCFRNAVSIVKLMTIEKGPQIFEKQRHLDFIFAYSAKGIQLSYYPIFKLSPEFPYIVQQPAATLTSLPLLLSFSHSSVFHFKVLHKTPPHKLLAIASADSIVKVPQNRQRQVVHSYI